MGMGRTSSRMRLRETATTSHSHGLMSTAQRESFSDVTRLSNFPCKPGSDEHIRDLVHESIGDVERKCKAQCRRLFGETVFLSLCVHNCPPREVSIS